MINHIYQLTAPRTFSVAFEDISLKCDAVIVRPTFLSICAADQRYFTGRRDKRTLAYKLPMALIHEACGKVVYDASGEFTCGENVVFIPNTPIESDPFIAENYLPSSSFRASGFDGFMQEYVAMRPDRIVRSKGVREDITAVTEIVSVAAHSVDTLKKLAHDRREQIGVWGDGNLGYLTALMVSKLLPDANLTVMGIDSQKLEYFSFADRCYHVDDLPDNIMFDHCFECVGGSAAEFVIDQMIDHIHPEGTMMLMGVSENNVPIRTRMVLEKGLRMIGRSRSGRADFEAVIDMMSQSDETAMAIGKIIREVIQVQKIADITAAFERDLILPFKTLIKWDI